MKAYELIEQTGFCTDFFAVNDEGESVDIQSPDAVAYDAVGAISRCYSRFRKNKMISKLTRYIRRHWAHDEVKKANGIPERLHPVTISMWSDYVNQSEVISALKYIEG